VFHEGQQRKLYIMARQIKHIHGLKVDIICSCGYRNKTELILEDDMNVIICGSCNEILLAPPEMEEKEKTAIRQMIIKVKEEVK